MALEATMRYEDGVMTTPYTPVADVPVGKVVVLVDVVGICVRPIAAGELGCLNIHGGVYRVAGDGVIAANTKVWWNDTAKQVTATASTHKFFGTTVTPCTGAAALCDVNHLPAGSVT